MKKDLHAERGVRNAKSHLPITFHVSRITHHASGLPRRAAFTLLEIMVAVAIFMLILTAIYSIWHGIIKGTRSGIKAVQEVQRSRIAMHSIQQAFLCARVFTENIKYYYFIGESSGNQSRIEMTCRLPADFLGMGFVDPNLRLRRVTIKTEPSKDGGGDELVMSHYPMLVDPELQGNEPYRIVLARDVSRFELEYVDPRKGEWVSEWVQTNSLPKLVRVTLGLGKSGLSSSSQTEDIVSRIIPLPAQNITGLQGARPAPGQPGVPPGASGFPPGGGRFPPGGGNKPVRLQ
jgi:general secretion pathway protein J